MSASSDHGPGLDRRLYADVRLGRREPECLSKSPDHRVADGGIFTLTFEGDTTGPIPFDATAAQVQAALEALPNIGPGNAETILGPVNTTGVVIDLLNAANPGPIQLLTGDATRLESLGGDECSDFDFRGQCGYHVESERGNRRIQRPGAGDHRRHQPEIRTRSPAFPA